jgi:hypothetical protein
MTASPYIPSMYLNRCHYISQDSVTSNDLGQTCTNRVSWKPDVRLSRGQNWFRTTYNIGYEGKSKFGPLCMSAGNHTCEDSRHSRFLGNCSAGFRQRGRPKKTRQQISENNLRTESNIWSKVPEWARYLHIMTEWPSVVMWLWLCRIISHLNAATLTPLH